MNLKLSMVSTLELTGNVGEYRRAHEVLVEHGFDVAKDVKNAGSDGEFYLLGQRRATMVEIKERAARPELLPVGFRWIKPNERLKEGDIYLKQNGVGWSNVNHLVGELADENYAYARQRAKVPTGWRQLPVNANFRTTDRHYIGPVNGFITVDYAGQVECQSIFIRRKRVSKERKIKGKPW